MKDHIYNPEKPNFFEKAEHALFRLAWRRDRLVKNSVKDYIPIAGIIDKHSCFLDNGAIVSVMEIQGGYSERSLVSRARL